VIAHLYGSFQLPLEVEDLFVQSMALRAEPSALQAASKLAMHTAEVGNTLVQTPQLLLLFFLLSHWGQRLQRERFWCQLLLARDVFWLFQGLVCGRQVQFGIAPAKSMSRRVVPKCRKPALAPAGVLMGH